MNLCKNCGISGFGDLSTDPNYSAGTDLFGNPIDWTSLSGAPPTTINASTTTFNPSIITSIAGAFSSIFKTIQPLPAGCTVVAGPYGQSTACSGTGTNPLSLTGSLSSMGGSSSLLLLGGAVLLIMLMKK